MIRAGRGASGHFLYGIAAGVVTVAVVAGCIIAARLGRSRFNNLAAYFYFNVDIGHPGVMNAVAATGFVGAAAVAAVLAVASHPQTGTRLSWIAVSGLLLTIGIDDLFRVHNLVPSGDIVSRVVYWTAFALLYRRLRAHLIGRRGLRMFAGGGVLLVVSELIDVFTPTADRLYKTIQLLGALEESAVCLAAWYFLVAMIGHASVSVNANDAPSS